MKKYAAAGAVLAAVLTALCACAPDTEGNATVSSEPPGRKYTIQLDSRTKLVFDENGEEIPPDMQFTVLYDLATGEPQCQKQEHVEDTGKDDEYGSPILRRTYALFDMEGNLLYDYAEKDYGAAFGDFLIRQDPQGFLVDIRDLPDPYHTELWNFKKGETHLDGVGSVEVLDDKRETFLLGNVSWYLMGVVDRDGSIISGFPPPEGYYHCYAWNGSIISQNHPFDYDGPEERREVLLTEKLEPVLSGKSLNGSYVGIRGNYLLCDDVGQYTVLDQDGQVQYAVPGGEDIYYFDGERVILRSGDPSESFTYRLIRIDGTEIASGFEELQTEEWDNNLPPAQTFIGRRGNTVELLDRDGKVTASREIPGITELNPLGDGLYSYSVGEYSVGLFDENLDVLIEPGTYSGIRRCTDWDNGSNTVYGLLECIYYLSGKPEWGSGIRRRDLLEAPSMKKIVSGLTSIDGIGPDRLAVVRGFSAGLMDWKGNWIVRKSIFQNLNDDYDIWSAYL